MICAFSQACFPKYNIGNDVYIFSHLPFV
jgi:hypothetical protein